MVRFLLLPVLIAAAAFDMNWTDEQRNAVKIDFSGNQSQFVKRCVRAGLAARFRFEMQVCRRRGMWFDRCSEPRVEVHTLQFDPVTDDYRLMVDRYDDRDQPVVKRVAGYAEALRAMSSAERVPLDYIARGKPLTPKRSYLSTRITGDCKGDYNRTLASISSFLTFGMVRVSGFDSGWVDFDFGDQ